jgi:PEP-CTERM motif
VKRLFVSLSVLGMVMLATVASASTLGVDYASAPGSGLCNTATCIYGFQFSVASPITVTALGAFDGGQGNPSNPPGKVSNLTNAVTVDLLNSSGGLIATAQVGGAAGGTQVGNWWAFNNITSVDLAAGTYFVVGVFSTDDASTHPIPNPTVGSGITLLQFEGCTNQNSNPGVTSKNGVCSSSPDISQFLTTTNYDQGSLGGNFEFVPTVNTNLNGASTVPEPGTLVLLGSALIVGAARLRRRIAA